MAAREDLAPDQDSALHSRERKRERMTAITTLFWDIGGVLLTNGWGKNSRREAAALFHLDWEDFEDRHELTFPAFEMGRCTLEQYLNHTIFYRPRAFTPEEFTKFMFAQSKELPGSRDVLRQAVRTGKYLVAALNNEPLELNRHRIDAFRLRSDFLVFFSSCYVGSRKPHEAIFQCALQITQRPAQECLFVDDRALNLETACRLGMRTVLFTNPAQLRDELIKNGIELTQG
jgi:putative hydrolase of the HAD superfamily